MLKSELTLVHRKLEHAIRFAKAALQAAGGNSTEFEHSLNDAWDELEGEEGGEEEEEQEGVLID